jgi:hypothetical protein
MVSFASFFSRLFKNIFGKKQRVRLGLYGPPNSGKTTLANRICHDCQEQDMGMASEIPHETRTINTKQNIVVKNKGKELNITLADTPGIATRIDFEDFIKAGLKEGEAKERAKEATKGVIQAIKSLDEMDAVMIILDSSKDPYSQVNITILGNLEARNIPIILVANKIDLKTANIKRVEAAFPNHKVVGISAKSGERMDKLYERMIEVMR